MAEAHKNRFRRFLTALVVGGCVGAIIGTFIKTGGAGGLFSGVLTLGDEAGQAESIEQSVAWQYATAYQEGDWDRVLALTLWAQDRIRHVAESEGEDAALAVRDALKAVFGTRTLADNYLRDTGVEDQYIFTPGARITFLSEDEGRDDLERPAARRTWIKVTYPARDRALLDAESIPVRSLRAGVNVSKDGYVLKANIVGNLEIDWASITYDWPQP